VRLALVWVLVPGLELGLVLEPGLELVRGLVPHSRQQQCC